MNNTDEAKEEQEVAIKAPTQAEEKKTKETINI